jgi:hypothetical protein
LASSPASVNGRPWPGPIIIGGSVIVRGANDPAEEGVVLLRGRRRGLALVLHRGGMRFLQPAMSSGGSWRIQSSPAGADGGREMVLARGEDEDIVASGRAGGGAGQMGNVRSMEDVDLGPASFWERG